MDMMENTDSHELNQEGCERGAPQFDSPPTPTWALQYTQENMSGSPVAPAQPPEPSQLSSVDDFRKVTEQMAQRAEDLQHSTDQVMQSSNDCCQETAKQLELLEYSLTRLEKQISSAQEEKKRQDEQLSVSLNSVEKTLQSLTACCSETYQRTKVLQKSLEALISRNTDVLRQTMDFTNSSARKWTKELEGYRSLFKDSVYDDIWKELARIYIGILNHLQRKNDPTLTEAISFCALEPLQELMDEHGVTIQVTPPGEKRSFMRTKAKGQVPTVKPELDATVAYSIWPGFMRDSLCILPEIVVSHVYQEGYQEPIGEEAQEQTSPSTQVAEESLRAEKPVAQVYPTEPYNDAEKAAVPDQQRLEKVQCWKENTREGVESKETQATEHTTMVEEIAKTDASETNHTTEEDHQNA